jgi:integrase
MRKTELRITKAKVRRGKAIQKYWCVVVPKLGGGRTRRFFDFTDEGRKEAETLLGISKTQQINYGTAALTLSPAERAEYMECREALKPYGATLRDAIRFYLPHLKARNRASTVKELVKELLGVKTADGASERYLGDLRSRLNQFADSFEKRNVASITGPEVDKWLRALAVAPITRNNFRRVLIVLFNFAKAQGYCVENPAKSSAEAKEIAGDVEIFTVPEIVALLENAAPELVPFIAIGAFAGIRRAELERLTWGEVDFQSGLIQVTAAKAKSARRRFVKIEPNLADWIRPYAARTGPVAPDNYRELMDAARLAAKLDKWPQNGLRHSFASYHLAKFQDAAALALQMGHTNSNLVFQHYRQIVKPTEAEKFWSVRPAVVENVVAMTA